MDLTNNRKNVKISLAKDSLVDDGMRRMWDGIRGTLDPKNLPGEMWVDISGFNGYEVSSFMRVRSKERIVCETKGKRVGVLKPIKESILRQRKNTEGYWFVRMSENGVRRNRLVHRLWCAAFMPNPYNKPYVNHKNLIKSDNIPTNLEWNTPEENTLHAAANGALPVGEQVKHCKISAADVMDIYKSNQTMEYLMRKYGITKRMVLKIRKGISWKSVTGGKPNLRTTKLHKGIVLAIYKDERSTATICAEYFVSQSAVLRIKKKQSYKEILNGLD